MKRPLLSPYTKYRILEIIPGTAVWTTLILVLALSFIKPLWMIYAAIIFDLYWLLRVLYFITYLFVSWNTYRKHREIDWMEKVREHDNWERIQHMIFLPMVDEGVDVVRHTFEGLLKSHFPTQNMMIVLAGEAREEEHFNKVADQIKEEYGEHFGHFLTTLHPAGLSGEVAGKGANQNWAGHRAQEYVDELGWNYDDIIVTSFDIDTVADEHYFSYLTNCYLSHPNPTRSSYQPMALYNNNVWESPSFARVVANSTTFWLMAELARPKPLWTFASHSMSFTALVDVGFWQADIVTEDSRIFLQCYIHYDGDYEVTSMYVPISMDTAYSGSFFGTVKNLYKQQRRWAWGVEHFPFMIWHFWRSKLTRKKWHLLFNLSEGMYSWATAPLLITILGYIPLWAAGDVEKATVIAQNAPFVLQWLMNLAAIGILGSAIMNVYLLPHDVPGNRWAKFGIMVAQWLLLPICLVFFGSFAVIDAQTRMMRGKYLGFYTTKKTR